MKNRLLRLTALLLVSVLLLLSTVSCANRTGKPMLTLEKDGIKVSISVNVYELLLSRMKGTLAFYGYTANGVNATSDAFWDYTDKFNGTDLQTIDEYYRNQILGNCKTFLVALYLFEREGLTLSAAAEAKIEDKLRELVLSDPLLQTLVPFSRDPSDLGINLLHLLGRIHQQNAAVGLARSPRDVPLFLQKIECACHRAFVEAQMVRQLILR